jgi:hypothetical protein
MRSLHTPLAALLALSLGTLANAGTRSTSDVGTLIAPGVPGYGRSARAIPDGSGGAYVGFQTVDVTSVLSVVAHLGADGAPDPAWNAHVITGYSHWADALPRVSVTSARSGNAWLFTDLANPGNRLSALIHPNWPVDADVTSTADDVWWFVQGVALDEQRALVTAFTTPGGLRVGVMTSTGVLETPSFTFGLPGETAFPDDVDHTMIPDGAGGAWDLAGVKNIGAASDLDVIAIRYAADGLPAWSPAARTVTAAARRQANPVICLDGSGGVYIAWEDNRSLSTSFDVYAMHLLADGSRAPGWPLNGIAVASAPADQFHVKVAEDGAGGCWLTWVDSRTGENDIYFTRLQGNGSPAPGYPVGGRVLCAASGSQIEPALIADGTGGFFSTWLDGRSGNLDLYGQHIHATGVVMPGWDADGTALCTGPSAQDDPWLVLSSPNHAIAGWLDSRTGELKYYSMVLPADGPVTGVPPTGGARLWLASAGPTRELEFTLSTPEAGEIRLEVFDTSGRRVAEVRRQGPLAGERVRIDAVLRPGLYLARAGQQGAIAMSRAVLIR